MSMRPTMFLLAVLLGTALWLILVGSAYGVFEVMQQIWP